MSRQIYFIPIRKGSKGVPGKNMKILGGKPLVCWVLDSIIASNTADEIWVATDDDGAERYLSDRYPAVRVFRRSESSATDTSPVIEVVLEFISAVKPSLDDWLILAQATSPFTPPEDFVELCSCFDECYESHVSCARIKRYLWHESGYPLGYNLNSKPRRQDYSGILIETGSFYASCIKDIVQTRQLLSGRINIIETSQFPNCNIDIDEIVDWSFAESIINITRNTEFSKFITKI